MVRRSLLTTVHGPAPIILSGEASILLTCRGFELLQCLSSRKGVL